MSFKTKRIVILICLFLAYWVAFFDRYLTSPTLPLLIKEWGLTMAAAGALSSLMLVCYSLAHIPFGYLSDKFGRAKFLIIGTATVGIVNVLASYAKNFAAFLTLRGAVGLGAAANHAPLMAMITDWFPSHRRGVAMSVLAIVTTLGPLSGLIWGKTLITKFAGAWQPVYFYTIIPALIVVMLTVIFVRDPNADDRNEIRQEEENYWKGRGLSAPPVSEVEHFTLGQLAKIFDKSLLPIYLSWFFIIAEFMVLLSFLPTLLVKLRGLGLQQAISISTGWLWTGLIVSLIGGWISDHFRNRKWWVLGFSMPAHLLIFSVPFLPVGYILPVLCFMGVCWFSTSGPFYAWTAELGALVNPRLIATILGFCVLFGDLGGALGAYLAGGLADKFGVPAVFFFSAACGLISILVLLGTEDTLRLGKTEETANS